MDGFSIVGLLFLLAWHLFHRAPGWLRHRQSQSWPLAEATIEGACVNVGIAGRGGRRYWLVVSYSYSVKGETHGGTYLEYFKSESAAGGALRSLYDTSQAIHSSL